MSGDDMVEIVARAICTAMGEKPDAMESRCLPGSYHTDDGEQHWAGYIDHARAAIEAMREPTEAMLRACVECPIYLDPEITKLKGFAKQRLKSIQRWHATIDAALIPPKSSLEDMGEPALRALKEESNG
jgi:hypothetical protein